MKTILFGGGCFWCTEAIFSMLRGLSEVSVGYSGGAIRNPTYNEVCDGNTGHAEVSKIVYDENMIDLKDLLDVFFYSHDPTSVNKQGNDIGTQYRSAIFYEDDVQKKVIDEYIVGLNASGQYKKPIVTEIKKMGNFYPAEKYHQKYFEDNKNAPYCHVIIEPKIQKVIDKYSRLLKPKA